MRCAARRADIQKTLAEWDEVTRGRDLYKRFAELLGRGRLQHVLLRRAEADIVAHANEVLRRIHGGALRLEERSGKDTGGGPGNALDLIAYNAEMADTPIPNDYLNGSQNSGSQ